MLNRRSLITGLIALGAAPAIVRASSIMPIKAALIPAPRSGVVFTELPFGLRVPLFYAEIFVDPDTIAGMVDRELAARISL